MKYFLAFLIIFAKQLFAADSWEYSVVEDRFLGERIVATRTRSGFREHFEVLETNKSMWNHRDFFAAPEFPMERHLIGKFVLQRIIFSQGFCRSSNQYKILDHKMHLSICWVMDEETRKLVHGPLENLGYPTSSVPVDKSSS
jgi:hypothetical protein